MKEATWCEKLIVVQLSFHFFFNGESLLSDGKALPIPALPDDCTWTAAIFVKK
jgi:hypothetical protein